MIREHDCIVLTSDLPDEGLRAGDVGTVVHIHGEAAAYEVEFVTLTGQTVAVATVLPDQLRQQSTRSLSEIARRGCHGAPGPIAARRPPRSDTRARAGGVVKAAVA